MENGAKTLKRITLEMGGNDAAIVCPDVDIKEFAPKVALGAFFNSGQFCLASKRLYIHQDIYEPFLAAMVEFVKTLKVGGDEEGVMIGPVQNAMQFGIVKNYLQDCKDHGYKFALGGGIREGKGYFIEPTIIDNPPNDSRIIQEETFGPVVPVQPWTDEAEVIARANDTQSGLGAAIYSKDVERATRIGKQLDTGSVWINSFAQPSPYGHLAGRKDSGIGGEWGPQGLLAFCSPHVMHIYK